MSGYARNQHARLDRDFAESEAGDRKGIIVDNVHNDPPDIARPTRWRQDSTVSGGRQPKVLLMTLSERTSAKGRRYFSGWLGKASVVAFEGEPDKFGNPSWDVFVNEPQPREGLAGGARARTYGREGSR
jgi:hypothetical protein